MFDSSFYLYSYCKKLKRRAMVLKADRKLVRFLSYMKVSKLNLKFLRIS